ncbi:flavodoxin family protein [Pokkaliibacter sp. CJK22405]|uniref:flavodoxin family protein n=1 Tax=Pokkaliibacter sp. CJK22405 TaxID=3384615 RepID=UPI0039848600
MARIVVMYHSGYGHTAKVAEAVLEGIRSVSGVESQLLEIDADGNLPDGGWETLKVCDAIVMGTPTYMGGPSWQFKKVADASSKPWFALDWKDKMAAGFTNSASMNGDKDMTLHYLMTLAMQHGMLWIGTGMLPSNTKSAGRNDINYLGSSAGLMTQSPSDASTDEGPLPGDLDTAREFGIRISESALRWMAAR